jgi:hypothetical protein
MGRRQHLFLNAFRLGYFLKRVRESDRGDRILPGRKYRSRYGVDILGL